MNKIPRIAAFLGAGLLFGTIAGRFLKTDRIRSRKVKGIFGIDDRQVNNGKLIENYDQTDDYFI